MDNTDMRRAAERWASSYPAREAKRPLPLWTPLIAAMICLLPLRLPAAASLELQYAIDRFAAFPELAEASVNAVAEDKDGAVWIGTQDGLFQFDGVNALQYRVSGDDSALLDNHVLSLLVDRRGRVWIGTMQGVDRFDPESGRFMARQAGQTGEWLTGVPVLSLLESGDGRIWAGTADSGLFQLSPSGEPLAHYDSVERGGVLSTPDIWDIEADSESGYLWLATESGIDRLDIASGQVDRRLTPPGSEENLQQRGTISSVMIGSDRNLWLTTLAGAWRYDRQSGQFESLGDWSESLAGSQMHVAEDEDGGLWFSSLESGVVHCVRPGPVCRRIEHDVGNPRSLPTNAVRKIFPDREGRLWIATNDGLARFVPERLQWGHYRFVGLDGEHPEVWAVTRWRDGLYLGTFGQGLWRADWGALQSQDAQVALERVELGHDTPWSLMVDSRSRLWVSTFGGGLFRFDDPGRAPENWAHDPDDPESISFNHLWHLTEDPAGIWAGTYGGGLDLIDPDTGRRLHNWFPDAERPIGSRRVPLVHRDSQGRLWAGTYGGGLNLLERDEGGFRAWRHDPADPQSLPHDFISDLAEGPDGWLWVATEGGGLARLVDPENGRFEIFDESNRLLNANLAGLHFASDDALWVSHKRGLQRYAQGRWLAARHAHGLQGGEFSSRAHAAPAPGWLVFGGSEGINVFAADSVTFPAGPAAPRIQRVTMHRGQQRQDHGFNAESEWGFAADVDAIGLRFSSYYMDSELLPRFRYRLNGGSWVVQHDPSLALAGLAPGRYQLELQAALEDGPWSSSTNWSFHVRPPWWASPWAWGVYLLLVGLLVWLSVRYRMRRVAAHNRYLKVLLKARSREHRMRVRALQAGHHQAVSEELLAQKRRLFASLAHELRTPLTALSLIVDAEAGGKHDTESPGEILQAVRTHVHRLSRVSRQILSLSDVVADDQQAAEVVELESEVRVVAGALRILLAERDIELALDLPHDLYLKLKPGSLELILFNLIDNAWKYAGEGARLDVRACSEGAQCLLEVADNGPGMSQKFAEQAFERRTREQGDDRENGLGLGLAAVHAMVEANGGTIGLETVPGQGCRFSIRLPLADAPEHEPSPERVEANRETPPPEQSLGRLLLVEDDDDLRDLMATLLSSEWTVLSADDGDRALAMVSEELPDVVVCDVDLPGLPGDQLCRRIKSDPVLAHTPVLLVTALDHPDQQAAGFAARADDYVTKPFDGHVLKARLRNLWQTLERTREHARRGLLEAARLNGADSEFVDRVRRLTGALLDEGRLSVDNLAGALHVSPRHLGRLFEQRLGNLTPRQYIDQLNARRAGERIAAGATLEQVAEELGYSSSSYLSRKFRQWYGVSVREFRHRNDRADASCPKSDGTGPASD